MLNLTFQVVCWTTWGRFITQRRQILKNVLRKISNTTKNILQMQHLCVIKYTNLRFTTSFSSWSFLSFPIALTIVDTWKEDYSTCFCFLCRWVIITPEQVPFAKEGHGMQLKAPIKAGKWTLTLDCFTKNDIFFLNFTGSSIFNQSVFRLVSHFLTTHQDNININQLKIHYTSSTWMHIFSLFESIFSTSILFSLLILHLQCHSVAWKAFKNTLLLMCKRYT